jgi:mono/diheme cytochrome c family protein
MTWKEISLGAIIATTISTTLLSFALPALGQVGGPSEAGRALSAGPRFAEKNGEDLFANVCRGCHMADGKGATGAGTYPSLAGNDRLEASGYPVAVVLYGQRGMPPFGAMMSDEQVAAVVNYVRSHFGNRYHDAVTVEAVRSARR